MQKANDKYKINIEKLNKKLNYYANTNKINKNISSINNECKSLFGNQTMVNTTLDSFNTPNSIILNSSKNNKKISQNLNQKSVIKNNEINEIIKKGINQCDEELKNLKKIEDFLIFKYKRKTKLQTRCNSRNRIKYKLYNKTLK